MLPSSSEQGYFGIIEVQPIRKESRPCLIIKVPKDVAECSGALVGLYVRNSVSAPRVSPYEIQSIMRDGTLFRDAILSRKDTAIAEAPAQNKLSKDELIACANNRTKRLTAKMQMQDKPLFGLWAIPNPPLDASKMFETDDNEIVSLLRNPPEIRTSGFDLSTGLFPVIVEGERRQCISIGDRGIQFYRDASLFFVAPGDDSFFVAPGMAILNS